MVKPEELINYDGPDRIVHFAEYLRLKTAQGADKATRVYMGAFPEFDKKLAGLETGELTVVTGKTGEGKTLFSESWMLQMLKANADLKACFFSFEVKPTRLLTKYAAHPQLKIYTPLELESGSFNWLEDRVWEAALKENCRLFIFDHVHYMIDLHDRQSLSTNIGRFMRELITKVAHGLNAAVILIAHQAKDQHSPVGANEAHIDLIKDSSSIGQEADNVIILGRHRNYTEAELNKLDGALADRIRQRKRLTTDLNDAFSDQFAIVQIAKGRRNGVFRWKKLFQKVGDFLEEV